jgi:hypothetical protein
MPCDICEQPVLDGGLIDSETGRAYHPACAVERLPRDAAAALAELLAIVLVPMIVRWAS